ncbi:MAG TPA: formate--tetrahydrofolate ligase [Flavobacteriales bacterium]|nr:formate--tetrahydrofolate ligase [Flavobacteriales bacterium]HQW33727.1 formate--tetrahydrofolate ligase [Flavobacteriales bacterium]HQY04309.1 formate--tetrahydrofolate ligase [Flavobacteriales bacterium]HQY81090.1 formate--tetrahydrofolate ligase [Flavobacteriales bacterium]HRA18255.1 formate--tetrahydrofolate ligase [Flavobacteriales bacterium]
MAFPSDLEIAQRATLQPITAIGEKLGIHADRMENYGRYKAKLPLDLIDESKVKKAKLILVTAISPTPAGEGKTTTSIGLCEGLNKVGKKAMVVLREPSLGPVFGMKGGAAGGGYAQVLPMEDINLHFTGDFAAIEKSNNLLAALIDNNIQSKTRNLGIDPRTIAWKRVMDMNDRALRDIVIGLGGTGNGIPREDGFNITAASEVMAILCLATGYEDLKERLGNIFVGNSRAESRKYVYARDLNAQGAMAVLLKDAIKPNLVQTMEGNPAIIHGGPFANIAQGVNSILGTKMGLSLADYVVTEAGFGADLGAEKFFDIKCRAAGLAPHATVIVATIRALRYQGGSPIKEVNDASVERVKKGMANLERHIENIAKFGVKAVVAINHFPTDTEEEIHLVKERCKALGVEAVLAKGFAEGGKGMTDLAGAVVKVVDSNETKFKLLYDLEQPIEKKVEIIAKEIYRAKSVAYSGEAKTALRRIHNLGLDHLPVCIAKTQYSFSDDPAKLGAATDFEITVNDIEIAAGAGFVVPILGKMMRMPGLPEVPASEHMDIDANGVISGLS